MGLIQLSSRTSPEQVASKVLREKKKQSTDISFSVQGRHLDVHMGEPSKAVLRVSADDMLNQQSQFHFSSRRRHQSAANWKELVKSSGFKADIPNQKAVDELQRSRTADLFTSTIVRGNVGTEANPEHDDITVVYCKDTVELCKRVCAHRQVPLGMVKVQGDHGQGSLKISVQPTASNSVHDLQLLAVTKDSGESVGTLSSILNLLDVGKILEAGGDLIITGDLKFLQLLYGIKTGHSKFPCV